MHVAMDMRATMSRDREKVLSTILKARAPALSYSAASRLFYILTSRVALMVSFHDGVCAWKDQKWLWDPLLALADRVASFCPTEEETKARAASASGSIARAALVLEAMTSLSYRKRRAIDMTIIGAKAAQVLDRLPAGLVIESRDLVRQGMTREASTVSKLQRESSFPIFFAVVYVPEMLGAINVGGEVDRFVGHWCQVDLEQRLRSLIEVERLTDDGMHRIDLAITTIVDMEEVRLAFEVDGPSHLLMRLDDAKTEAGRPTMKWQDGGSTALRFLLLDADAWAPVSLPFFHCRRLWRMIGETAAQIGPLGSTCVEVVQKAQAHFILLRKVDEEGLMAEWRAVSGDRFKEMDRQENAEAVIGFFISELRMAVPEARQELLENICEHAESQHRKFESKIAKKKTSRRSGYFGTRQMFGSDTDEHKASMYKELPELLRQRAQAEGLLWSDRPRGPWGSLMSFVLPAASQGLDGLCKALATLVSKLSQLRSRR